MLNHTSLQLCIVDKFLFYPIELTNDIFNFLALRFSEERPLCTVQALNAYR